MTTSGPLTGFQGHFIVTSRISQKTVRFKDKVTNRKPYTVYRMVPLSMTLSDLWLGFQGHEIF